MTTGVVTITHKFISRLEDSEEAAAAGQMVPSNWNDVHEVVGAAPLDSPEFVGTPSAPTPPFGDTSARLATMEAVAAALNRLGRTRLMVDTTFHVDSAGSDTTTDGLSPGVGAFATVQHAYDNLADNYDIAGVTVTIQCASGQTYTNNSLHTSKFVIGQGDPMTVIIDGGGSTFTRNDGGHVFEAGHGSAAVTAPRVGFQLQNMTITATAGGGAILADGATITLGSGMVFGAVASPGSHIVAYDPGSLILCNNSYSITGGANTHFNCDGYGRIVVVNTGITITLTGTPGFNAFALARDFGHVYADAATFSGSATGQRYLVQQFGNLNNVATGATFFPGSTAGSIDSGFYGGVNGTNTNDAALAGNIGEIQPAALVKASALTMASGIAQNVTSVMLPAGDWDVSGICFFAGGSTTTVAFITAGLTTTSATSPDANTGTNAIGIQGGANQPMFSFGYMSASAGPTRFSQPSSKTVYNEGHANFGVSTCVGWGSIRARRIR